MGRVLNVVFAFMFSGLSSLFPVLISLGLLKLIALVGVGFVTFTAFDVVVGRVESIVIEQLSAMDATYSRYLLHAFGLLQIFDALGLILSAHTAKIVLLKSRLVIGKI